MGVQEIARTFGVDWPHLAAQIVSFSIVCALLYRFAYMPVLRMLDARREQIAQGLANTEKINARLAEIDGQRQTILAAARDEGARLVADARNAARRIKEQEAEQAHATAERIVADAREAATQERARMRIELRREMGHLVVETTAAVTGKILTASDQRRLVEETVRRVA